MNHTKKIFTACIVALVFVAASVTTFAASAYTTPAKAVAGITGRTTDSVIAERMESGKTYGTIAAEVGKLDEFKTEMLKMKKDNLAKQVEAGTITQEKADAILEAIDKNQAVCDGTGSSKISQGFGARLGSNGSGQGFSGANRGAGMGRGQGGGRIMNNGMCAYK